ncbi:protocadherin Fat 1 [Chanos chanos]|uniref:Protocadherin Fat 1 n=1 Tax=Chanos chanos TaxID=29144 RepID=A0A6J2UQ81_CHACN|nr:protocadherin Fat 1 [Chanos chanos]
MGKQWSVLLLMLIFWSCTGAQQILSMQFTRSMYNASIYENAAAKTFVQSPIKMGIYMVNPSWDIWYQIESGNQANLFKAEKYVLGDFCFLRIRTKGGSSATLNREVKDHHLLRVKAIERHSGSEAQTTVYLQVLDTNDLRPLFSPTSYNITLPENTPIKTSIGRVTASDADTGTNGECYFSFKEWTNMFSIHPTTGIITLTGKLDYSDTSLYELDILAVDRGLKLYGSSGISSTAKLTVCVQQANVHAPVITAVPLTPWNTIQDPTYAFVTVEDDDEGQNGEIASLNIVAGDPLQQFKAIRTSPGSKEYKIKAVKDVEWEGYSYGYNLTLQAKDKGDPPRFSSAKVVRIRSPHEYMEGLKFEKSIYQVSLSEFAPPNSSVVMVRITPKHPNVKYSIQHKMQHFKIPFTINPKTGLITTTGPVQADRVSKYEFDVVTNNKRTRAKVIVNIIDVNNNAPKFQRSSYEASVDENVPVGTSILTVSASDLDDGENGYVTYSIINTTPQPFQIDYFTGVISTVMDLDCELMPSKYFLRIRASDWGAPFRREAETMVSITLNNLNDNKPLFENIDCDVTVPRSLGVGEQIMGISAIDADDLGAVQYEIRAGNDMSIFDLDPSSGVLSLKKSLNDDETAKLSQHTLQITANDGEMSSAVMLVNITVVNTLNKVHSKCVETGVLRDLAGMLLFGTKLQSYKEPEDAFANIHSINSDAPRFMDSTPGLIEVKEDLPVGSSIVLLRATDADSGFNGKLLFVISGGDTDSCFTIESDSGLLKIYEPLDRETTNRYVLNITVYDLGLPQRYSSHNLEIKVLDVNDNSPQFLQDGYTVNINENTAVGTDIIQLEATDKDLGINGVVRYKLLTETDKFIIDEETGIVTVNGPLDREVIPFYSLIVAAQDMATEEPQMVSTVLLTITLEDDNDNAPVFIPLYYHIKVREDIPVGTLVLWLEAYDPDLGQSGQVRYSLTDDGDGVFQVDKTSGAVYLSAALDYESRQVYNLTVKVKDKGKPNSLSSTAVVAVEVVDVNENLHCPSFSFFADWGGVSEDSPIGTSVMKVTALDEDTGRDGEIRYSIRDGSGLGVFTIDEESGIISTQELLDRETTNHYWLTVYATDQGVVPLSSHVEIYIEVQDVNDNAPQSPQPVYYPSVLENSPKDVSIMKMEAFDPDSSSDKLSFKITSGNPQGFFTINSETGLLTTTSRKLDREKQEQHILEVTVSDHVSPSKSSTVRVIVKVLDENDNSPQFLEKVYKIKLPERERTTEWEPVYRVIAFDKDESLFAEISYSIHEGDKNRKFFIDPKTGLVSSKEAFSAGEYNILTIRASDNGNPQRSSICRLHIEWITRPKPPSKPLVFEETSLAFTVMESDPVGHMVGVIDTDPIGSPVWLNIKGDLLAKDVFHIVQMACDLSCLAEGGNDDSRFDVERGSGAIIIAKNLDAEQQSYYNLTVEATDGTRAISTQVSIQVIDTNEHRPEFSQTKFEISIPEETQPGVKILEISATDEDEKNKLTYTLLSSTDPHSLKKFRLDPATGFLYTSEKLDHETMHRHVLTVMVRDQDVPMKRNLARVIVNVTDSNDNAPWFTSSQYSASVFESAAIGSAVLQVTALDKDKGRNAEILYSIDSGNDGNSFAIDSLSGIITVARELDRNYRSQFELTVKASDKGEPPLRMFAKVQITVTVSDNGRPKFPQNTVAVEISETLSIGSFVTSLIASSQSSVFYQITDGNVNSAFDINPNSGIIVTRRNLDYETQPSYKLTVQGTNMAGVTGNATVLIRLRDENDNVPVFTQMEFTGYVSESAKERSVVLTRDNEPLVIRATDADEDSKSRLIYQIVEPFAHNYFTIDSGTGVIQTITSLDYEQRSVFHFTVQVHDTGTPRLFSETAANVTIQVVDVNDCPPKFSQDLYEASLLVPTYKGVKVISLNATDEDFAFGARLLFSISDGNVGHKFRIDSTSGDIFVQNATHLRSRYKLAVRVSDGRFTDTAVVKVTVRESENHGLKFTQDVFTASVQENLSERKTIAIIAAVGNRIHEPLFYSILNPDRRFEIGRTSGVLFTTGIPFDREEQDVFDVVVEVTKEQKSAGVVHVLVKVTVEDMNDNAPIFVNMPYSVIVQMDSVVSTVFRQVTAVDRDIGKNAQIKYYLKEHEKYFQLSPSGEISLKKSFEPDSLNTKFVITIIAQDEGDPALSSTAQVSITVVNRATPVFERPFYSIEIPENTQLHTSIAQVQVNDSVASRAVYSISEGDPFNQFSINFNSGVIDVVQPLDFETHPAYKLSIRATDSVTGAHSEVFVDIIVEDVNDNAPLFVMGSYNTSLPEYVMIGTSAFQVMATDSDTGDNRQLFYQLVGEEAENFRIDSESGIIFTAGLLDHEAKKQHKLMVKAVDGGAPPMSSEVQVTVYVTDFNDNPPVFTQQIYTASVSELVPPGHFVTCVQGFDVDSLNAETLEYSILSGNDDNSFTINKSSGEIMISSQKKQKMEPMYNLILSVTDGVFQSLAEVKVSVVRENRHNPSFTQDEYLVELLENSPTGTFVVKVEALDEDMGKYGEVQFFIVNDAARDKFSIDAKGQIFTFESFDRENPLERVMFINVMAKDGGGKVGFCTVSVILTDVNDNAPQFRLSEYKGSVPGDAPRGTTVIKISAVDADEGSNADIAYAVDSDIGHFEIHPVSGVVVTKGSVSGLENSLYSFYVKAKDSGSPPKQSVIPVSIRILPHDVMTRKLVEPLLRLEIAEDLPVGSEIDVVRAQSKNFLKYSLVKGNTPESNRDDAFIVDSNTGKLKVAKRLDYETTKWYQLTLQVQIIQEGAEFISNADVNILLKDVNDNKPQFDSHSYQSFVVENSPAGTSVIQIKATDLDSGVNAEVVYSLDENQDFPEVLELFAVNRETGWITTQKELDREKRDRYRLAVVAVDRGQEIQMNDSSIVEVTVVDTNDNPPVFAKTVFKKTVKEDEIVPGSLIILLSITDSDTDEFNRKCSCFITGGDPLGLFDIQYTEGSWVIAARKPLDREESDFHLLNITATDGAFVARATVEITVLDANDNSPVCDKVLYVGTAPEDAPAGTPVLQVSATDADLSSNAAISYQLFGSGAEAFSIDSHTGALSTLLPFDREQKDVFNFTVRAVDGGNRFCQAAVLITVEDVNDNSPKFLLNPYHLSVFENTKPGAYVARLQASDSDSGVNAKIRFSLEDSAGGQFSIHEQSGIITLEKPLERKIKALYALKVRAADQGSPRALSSLGTVLVTVLDADDHPLVFEHRDYVTTVPEDVAMGTRLLRVFAACKDAEVDAKITYSITEGNEHGAFSVDSRTGDVFVIEELDYEVSHEHYLTIKATATDKYSPSDTTTVAVHITDVNDNAPVFSQDVYSAVVSEDVQLGSTVVIVTAKDIDGPSNSRVRLSIVDGNQGSPFLIDTVSGEVRVARQLDREKTSGYALTVLASDSGNPPKSSSTVISIDVSDVNDNPPLFSRDNHSLIIQESVPLGSDVLQLNVTDSDTAHNGPPFSYTITEGNEGNFFQIDQDGILRTSAQLNCKVKDQYFLKVQVADSGNPPLKSTTFISIRVVQASVYPPSVLPLDVLVSVHGEEYAGGLLGKIHATDQDDYDTLTYSLHPQAHGQFSVSGSDGRLLATRGLDAGVYPLNVSVTDGRFTSTASVTVTVRQATRLMLDDSVSVRFAGVSPEEFIRDHWRGFQKAVRGFAGVRRNEIHLVSLQPAEDPEGNLDVLLFFEKLRGGTLEALLQKLNSSTVAIQEMVGLRLVWLGRSLCAGLRCPAGLCQETVTLDETVMTTYSTEKLSIVVPQHRRTAQCLCTDGTCSYLSNPCDDQPCPEGTQCVADQREGKYICTCLGENEGKCQEETLMTFGENSYIRFRLRKVTQRELKLSLRLKTFSSHGTVMFARGRNFSVLEIVGGRLQYQFDCGGGPSVVSVHSAEVNDGHWHSVQLEVTANRARLVLDQLHTASGIAPGSLCSVHLGNRVILGSHVHLLSARPRGGFQITKSLQGCMDSVVLNGQKLSLSSKPPSGADIEEMSGVSPGCEVPLPQDCLTNPCLNGGSCLTKTTGGYYCKCNDAYVGTHCEVSKNPCASNPCLYGGTCVQTTDSYYCQCRGKYSGQRCQIAPFCKVNPCRNGGQCIDGLDGPVCDCGPGFTGKRCLSDVNECVQKPCLNGGQCVNTHGSFGCTCVQGFGGKLCEVDESERIRHRVVSTPWNIGLNEVVGIIIFLTAICFIVTLFVIARKKPCKPNKPDPDQDDYGEDHAYNQSTYFHPKPPPGQFLDTPPKVPVRPISYTPSTPGDLRNNLDRSPEFSSLGSDPVFGLRKPVAVCSVAPNLPPRPTSCSPTDIDSVLEPNWEEEYGEDLDSCLLNESMEDVSNAYSHGNGGNGPDPHTANSHSDFIDDNGYHWDNSDWIHCVQIPGIQGHLHYEFVQIPSSTHFDDLADTEYLSGCYDIENSDPPHVEPPPHHDLQSLPKDECSVPVAHRDSYPPTTRAATSHVQRRHGGIHGNQTTVTVPQGSTPGPSEFSRGAEPFYEPCEEGIHGTPYSLLPDSADSLSDLSTSGEDLGPIASDSESVEDVLTCKNTASVGGCE